MSDEPDGAAGEDADQTGALTQPLRPRVSGLGSVPEPAPRWPRSR